MALSMVPRARISIDRRSKRSTLNSAASRQLSVESLQAELQFISTVQNLLVRWILAATLCMILHKVNSLAVRMLRGFKLFVGPAGHMACRDERWGAAAICPWEFCV